MQALQAVLIASGAALHRRYNVTSYRRVPAARFAEAVGRLESLTAEGNMDADDTAGD
jgi:hypothetical protein